MKSFFINSEAKTIKVIHIKVKPGDTTELCSEIRRLVGCKYFDARTLHSYDDGCYETVWFDDEGLFKPQTSGFRLGDTQIVGNGLILCTDFEGGSMSTRMPVEAAHLMVTFLEFNAGHPVPEPSVTFESL
jgi:hypothetical protein